MGHITYKKLWKMLIDRDMIKKDLREGVGLSPASMAKLAKNSERQHGYPFEGLQFFTVRHIRYLRGRFG